jgi:hypothetical protein
MAIETTRTLARLPHKICWFEIDQDAMDDHHQELHGELPKRNRSDLDDGGLILHDDTSRVGWLLRRADETETAIRASIFTLGGKGACTQQPLDVAWTTDNTTWGPIEGEMLIQVHKLFQECFGVPTSSIALLSNDMTHLWDNRGYTVNARNYFVASLGYELRRILTLVACINDIPMGVKEVKATHGFVAAGRYHKFLDHSIITLELPKGRDPIKLARSIIARIRRRAHQVRGHWRDDWRQPVNKTCLHDFDEHMVCRQCGGHQIWVHEHQRGDASLGFVVHDYDVRHDNPD